jgi:hypothetical protein
MAPKQRIHPVEDQIRTPLKSRAERHNGFDSTGQDQ